MDKYDVLSDNFLRVFAEIKAAMAALEEEPVSECADTE